MATSTSRYTNAEWEALTLQTQRAIAGAETKQQQHNGSNGSNGADVGVDAPLDMAALAKTIDHTLLKLEATLPQIDGLCDEARRERFATVCVRLQHVARAISNLKGSGVGVACVVGFHEGTYDTNIKLVEAQEAVRLGATELDIVINHPQLIAHTYEPIYKELAALRTALPAPTTLKLILETSQLSPLDIIAGTCLAAAARLDCVKTSTGFCGRGASVADVRLMAAAVDALAVSGAAGMFVKASGGVRGLGDARTMLAAGAERIGTSSGVWIMQEARAVEAGEAGLGAERPAATRLYTDNSIGGY
ncbi:uncharacterized protein K452DRAFT_324236 [Aplosporella prunicola CBS 121167]|uniref:deoxyribose-phosphate aldolase n=1 Tax=Aplosporella prunicola CBS 121167 TaxID=1176127 RepID=A0A6A6BUB2_9PEZI|nr:uncharacterized protein K452DRAFT_324236 [Aplosporella prunicola CBS 121167]KAF2146231.1 hypothetical protein K452DRAFT_324236 [Aplosporella prunicola CBS 121167]